MIDFSQKLNPVEMELVFVIKTPVLIKAYGECSTDLAFSKYCKATCKLLYTDKLKYQANCKLILKYLKSPKASRDGGFVYWKLSVK